MISGATKIDLSAMYGSGNGNMAQYGVGFGKKIKFHKIHILTSRNSQNIFLSFFRKFLKFQAHTQGGHQGYGNQVWDWKTEILIQKLK